MRFYSLVRNKPQQDMENYVVRFAPEEREAVLSILSRSNDIIINQVEPTSANITIQLEESDQAYQTLLDQIQREVHTSEVIIVKTNHQNIL
jgi:ribosomal protein L24